MAMRRFAMTVGLLSALIVAGCSRGGSRESFNVPVTGQLVLLVVAGPPPIGPPSPAELREDPIPHEVLIVTGQQPFNGRKLHRQVKTDKAGRVQMVLPVGRYIIRSVVQPIAVSVVVIAHRTVYAQLRMPVY
jgi:hypothetical protein